MQIQQVSRTGSGPVLLLIHGVGLDRQMWRPLSEQLEDAFDLVSYDMLGHGDCSFSGQRLTLPALVAQLQRVIAQCGLEQFSLVGFSMGALVAQAYAVTRPAALQRLVLLHSVHERSPQQRASIAERLAQAEQHGPAAIVEAALARWFTAEFAHHHPKVLETIRARLKANKPEQFLAAYRMFAGPGDLEPFPLERIRCPTLVATGELDIGSTPAMGQALAAAIADGYYEQYDGLAHMAPVQDPARVAASIRRFMDR